MSRRFLYFALIGLVLGALLVGLPIGLKHLAEQQLRAQLDPHGVDFIWDDLSWRWPTTVELSDVALSTTRDNIAITGDIERVTVNLSADALRGKTAQIGDISLRNASLKAQQIQQDTDQKTNNNTQEAQESASAEADVEALWKTLWKSLGKAGSIDAKDLNITLLDDTDTLLALQIDTLNLSPPAEAEDTGDHADFSPPQASHRRLDMRGHLDLKATKYSDYFARFDGSTNGSARADEIPWALSGYLVPGERALRLKLSAPSPDRALLSLHLPRFAELNVEHLIASVDRSLALELSAQQMSLRLGSRAKPAVELQIARLQAVATPANLSPAWSIFEPSLAVAPAHLSELRRSIEKLRTALQTARPPSSASSAAATPAHDKSGAWRTRLAHWLQRADLRIMDGHFDLRLVEGDTATRTIALAQNFQGSLRDGRLLIDGHSAGGRAKVGAEFVPGSWRPRSAFVDLNNIRLDDLPGIKEGRTLPKRGIRGRIGGIIDANLVLWTESHSGSAQSPDATLNLGGSLAWRDGKIEVSGLAEAPIDHIDAGADFKLSWAPRSTRIELSEARLQYGPVVGHLRGTWTGFPLNPVLDLHAEVDAIDCQEAVRAMPTALLGAYRHIEIEGNMAPRFSFYMPVHHPRKLRIRLEDFVDLCHVTALKAHKDAWPEISIAEPPAPKPKKPGAPAGFNAPEFLARFGATPKPEPWPAPAFVRDETYALPELPETHRAGRFDDVHWLNMRFVKQVTEGISEEAEVFVGPGTPGYQPLQDLPPFVAAAAYLSEEMQFYNGHGISLGLIERALRLDFEKGRFVYGGSTVTQQLVKNLFLSRDKKLSRKFKEALIAWRIEDAVPKWRVLELYINIIEYAQDIYGIGPAARYYFDKDAADLTPKEAVFLAVLKPAPWYGDRFRRRGATPSKHWWFNRMGEIMGRLVDKGYLTPEQAEAEKPYILHWDKDGTYRPDLPAAPPQATPATEPDNSP